MSEITGRLPATLCPPLHWRRPFLGLVLLVASEFFTPAEAQFSNGYSFRRKVDFVDAEVIAGPHANFPVLIDSTLLYLRTTANGGKVENANGYDIIFTSDQAGANQLSHEIERYDAIVDEPTGATHFDSTSNNRDGIQQGNVEAPAQIGDGQDFDPADTGDYIEDADGELYINGLTAFTVSLWIQPDLAGTDRGFIIGKTPDEQDTIFSLRYDSAGADGGGTDVIKAGITVSGQVQEYESSSNVQTTAWQYLAWNWSSGNNQSLYIDGMLDTPTYTGLAHTGSISGSDRFQIGQGVKSPTGWDGRIDEVRLSSVIRSAPWIETEYNNQFSPATFYVLGAEKSQLVLVKRAFFTDGTPIPTDSSLPKGTPFDFMIYVNNMGDVSKTDLSIRDVLDPLFVYTAGTIYIDNSQPECALLACTAAEEASIRTAALATTVKTDIVDADAASFAGVTIDVGNQVITGNAQQDTDANKVLAVVFRVQMQ